MEQATVIKSTGSWYEVKTGEGELFQCRIPGKLRLKGVKTTNPVAVGDRVVFEIENQDERTGIIKEIKERRNYIIRKSVNLSKQTQIIAANLDQAILIVTIDFPKTFPQFIDRFLVTAEAYDIPGVIVFNKLDLYDEPMLEELEFFMYVYKDAGYKVCITSVEEQEGLKEFEAILKDKTSLLSGHSGVGKSSLINAVEPKLDLKTSQISDSHKQGQHTTTFAEMFELSFGGKIIDTPGIKGFGLVDMEKEEIGDYFPEIFNLKKSCRFHNCLHLEEPGCAVKEALENGKLAPTRYQSYVGLVTGSEEDDTYRKDIYAT